MYDAWYEASREKLALVYGGGAHPGTTGADFFASQQGGWTTRPAQHAGGVVGTLARWFWGEPQTGPGRPPVKLHVPAAGDIATTSASLLFGEPPTVSVDDDDAAQARLDELFDETLWAQIVTAAEHTAGLGGVYLRVGWDTDVADRPLLSVIGPDCAVPRFRWGRLAEVTFCWVLSRARDGVLRHLEHHSAGRVEHGLYLGDDDTLGRPLPLADHDATAPLASVVDAEGGIVTGLDRLDVVYVPNKASRAWRNHPVAAAQGQPHIAGVEPLLDALDEAATSWMRDVRLGKARLVVPQAYLDNLGRGKGAMLDLDREVFVGVQALPESQGMHLQATQFAIRHAEHAATVHSLLERIVTGAGFSAQTFGLTGDVAMTATEAHARERKTVHTRGGMIRHWRQGLADLAEILLAVDQAVFAGTVAPLRPDVEWPPYASDGPETLGRTAQLLRAAQAASTETLVRLAHPEWDTEQVDAEVTRIIAEADRGRVTQPTELEALDQLDELEEMVGDG